MAPNSARDPRTTADILLVDDNRQGLNARCVLLREVGFHTTGAASAKDALALFRKQHFDLVVTDFRMPDADGVELIAALRELRPGVPVVLLSGFVEPLGLTEKSTGAGAVLAKSANEVQHLIRAINRLLKPAARRKPPATAEPARTRRKAVSSS